MSSMNIDTDSNALIFNIKGTGYYVMSRYVVAIFKVSRAGNYADSFLSNWRKL